MKENIRCNPIARCGFRGAALPVCLINQYKDKVEWNIHGRPSSRPIQKPALPLIRDLASRRLRRDSGSCRIPDDTFAKPRKTHVWSGHALRPQIETIPLEKAFEAYQKMQSGNVKFRIVLIMKETLNAHQRRYVQVRDRPRQQA